MNPSIRLVAAALAVALAGCAGDKDDLPATNPFKSGKSERELRLEADGLYKLARRSLETADYQGAIQRYDQIQLRYPFTDYATQAQLEAIYAKYRNYEADSAVTAADRFLKEHPRHPLVDYVYYLRGLINFQRGESVFEGLPLYDASKADMTYLRRAYDDFALMIQRHPKSRYVADARERMIFLRNRMAEHELNIVRFYVRRGAHVAVIKRVEQILAQYPGAPATVEALQTLERSYRALGMTLQADETLEVLAANNIEAGKGPQVPPSQAGQENPPLPELPPEDQDPGTLRNP